MFVTFEKTPSFDKNKLLNEYKFLWNIIVKGIDIFVLKGFDIIYVKSMVRKWCHILLIHRQ